MENLCFFLFLTEVDAKFRNQDQRGHHENPLHIFDDIEIDLKVSLIKQIIIEINLAISNTFEFGQSFKNGFKFLQPRINFIYTII